jgi:hypothetical protein
VNKDKTPGEKIDKMWQNESVSVKKAKELYRYISKNYVKYSFFDYQINSDDGKKLYDYVTTDKAFFDLYGLKVSVGQNFTTSTDSNGSITPVVIGSDLAQKYNLNEVFSLDNPNTGVNEKYRVIGILQKGLSYPSPYNIGDTLSVDNKLFTILTNNDLNEFANLDMAISSLVIFANNNTDVQKIETLSSKLNLFNMHFEKITDNTDAFLAGTKRGMQIYLIICIALCLIMLAVGILSIYFSIKNRLNEYLVKFVTGLSIKKIILSFLFPLILFDVILMSILTVINNIVSKNIVYQNNISLHVVLGLILLVCDIVISIIPWFQLHNNEILSKIRGENG